MPPAANARIDRRLYWSLLVALVPSIVLAFLYFRSMTAQQSDEVESDLRVSSENLADGIARHIESLRRSLRNLTSLKIFAVALEYQRFEGLEAFFNSVTTSDAEQAGMLFVDDENRLVAHNDLDATGAIVSDAATRWQAAWNGIHWLGQDSDLGVGALDDTGSALFIRARVRNAEGLNKGWLVGVYRAEFVRGLVRPTVEQHARVRALALDYSVYLDLPDDRQLLSASPELPSVANHVELCGHSSAAALPVTVCLAGDLGAIHAATRWRQFAILVGLVASMGLLAWTSLVLMRRSLRVTRLILDKLEQIAAGNLDLLPRSGNAYTDRYVKATNEIIGRIAEYGRSFEETTRYMAIAQTTQMLAHDVRKPFSMLKMGLSVLARVRTAEEAHRIAMRMREDIGRALAKVNGMIDDVMESSRDAPLALDDTDPMVLTLSCLTDVVGIQRAAKVTFSYELQHDHQIRGDIAKLTRAISNILDNAIQAVNKDGHIWIATCNASLQGRPAVQLTLGNNGPAIAEADLPKLFDAFYTRGKKLGTGLGLAIAKKVVGAHGGSIWCESRDGARGVEFHMLLPAAATPAQKTPAPLPRDGAEIMLASAAVLHAESLVEADKREPDAASEPAIEERIRERVRLLGRPLVLAIVDDESLYVTALRDLLATSGLAQAIEVRCADTSHKVFNPTSEGIRRGGNWPDFMILDVDLGAGSLDGFELTEALRTKGYRGALCIHSNRSLAEDYRRAVVAGADAFLPKPMSRAHLLRFLDVHVSNQLPNSRTANPRLDA